MPAAVARVASSVYSTRDPLGTDGGGCAADARDAGCAGSVAISAAARQA